MARPRLSARQKLARALEELHGLLGSERGVVRGPQISNANRLLLLEAGYLREILRGWYFVSDPTAEICSFIVKYFHIVAMGFDRLFSKDGVDNLYKWSGGRNL